MAKRDDAQLIAECERLAKEHEEFAESYAIMRSDHLFRAEQLRQRARQLRGNE
jgi:hypothetical protein